MIIKFKRKQKWILLFVVIAILAAFFNWENNSITINEITFKNDSIPESFNGYKILQISDLHNKEFGNNQNKILGKIKEINPDIIVVTGDLIDANKTNVDVAMELINGAVKVAPVYYVSGNHEAWFGAYEELKCKLENSGVTVLDNEKVQIFKDNNSIDIIGVTDTSFAQTSWMAYAVDSGEEKTLLDRLAEGDNFKILLSHRPELFDVYSNTNVNLIFTGHAHGGQFRLPFIGGLVAPDQGFFPKLTEGIHTKNNRSMVISRGLGNSIIPLRLFNRPELVVVTLSK